MAILGLVLLLLPVGGELGVQVTGYFLLAAAAMEAVAGIKERRDPVRLIELLMSGVAAGAALLLLLRPSAYHLVFLAILCLAVRGVGAVTAGALSEAGTRVWIVGRGILDLTLAVILLVGAPLAGVISVLSGAAFSGQQWPANGDLILVNFVAASILITGVSLIGTGFAHRRQIEPREPER